MNIKVNTGCTHFWNTFLFTTKNKTTVPILTQTEVQCTCIVAECTLPMQYTKHSRLQCTLPLHSSDLVYTAQSMQSMYSVHCSYPAVTLHVHCTAVWGTFICSVLVYKSDLIVNTKLFTRCTYFGNSSLLAQSCALFTMVQPG